MKGWFERLPIHRKLVVSALLITAVALFVATLGLSIFDVWRYRTAAAEDAGALASVLAENTAAAVMFNQTEAAEDILRSVRVRNVVTRVCIFLPGGEQFAGFSVSATTCPARVPPEDGWSGVYGAAPVMRNGRTYGTVYVERSLSDLQRRLLITGLAGIVMFAVAALAAYLLAQRVNATISRPIADLADVVRRFGDTATTQLPDIRAAPDELGQLVTAFSEMVTRVRTASDDLRRTNEALLVEKAERETALMRQLDSDRRFKTLADGSPVLLWVYGPEGCEFVNRAYTDFFGLDTDLDVRRFDWVQFVHPDDRESYLEAYRRAFETRTPFHAESRVRRRDQEWRWMRAEATPRIENDVFVGFVGASIDITERRRAEEALREADQRKDAFLAVLAHELRNPLAPLRNGIELLRMGLGKPDAIQPVLAILERQVAHMVHLVDDLLDVSRITSGKIRLQRQPTGLAELVNGAIDANRAVIASADLSLHVHLPETPCLLDVDPTRFVQVLSNVLNNSVKFTDRGGRIDLVAAVNTAESPPLLTLTVSDSGDGIAPATLPRIFDFFVQGDTPGRGKSGLGIGLGLARQLMELHGGSIEAQSEGPGRGTTVTLRLPVLETTPVQAGKDALRASSPFTGRRVVVIDDNEDAADTLAALVAALGAEAATAYSGPDGLRAVADLRPDIVLLDIGMPDLDGYETCRRLRAEPFGQSAYIVALTGFGQVRDRERALADGFDAHLTKPADPRILQELLTARAARRVAESN